MTTSRGKNPASKAAIVKVPLAQGARAAAAKNVSTARRQSGETHLVEWKESWRDEYLRWLCGFANADGGTLVIGMSDKGEPVGAEDADRLLVDLPNKIRDTLGLVVPVRAVTKKGKDLIELVVEASPTPISYRGEYHFRSGSTKQQLTGNALSTFLLRKFGRHWDGAPVPNIAVQDLSAEAFNRFKGYARGSARLPPGALSASRAELIEKLRLTENGMLKRAALLLFDEDPERWVTGAWVKLGMFRGGADLAYHDEVHGDLFSQMDKTLELIFTKYMVAWIGYRGIARTETFPIPREAMREALLNALIHKDYSSGNPIQIRVETDRLSIWNAGPLPPSWTAKTLLERHTSQPHNPDIASAFFRSGLIEAWGRGYERITEACREQGTPEPKVESDGNGVWIKWAWVNPTSDADRIRPRGEVSDGRPVAPPLTPPLTPPLGDPVERLLVALAGGDLDGAGLRAHLKLRDKTHLRERYINPALAGGLIEMTIPDKPNSRLQRYRLTAEGQAKLAAKRGGRR